MKRLTIRISDKLHYDLKLLTFMESKSINEVVEELIKKYVSEAGEK